MNTDLVNVFKILVLVMIVAARYHDRIRDFKFGDMKVKKPKKERMKKLMNLLKRTWRFWTPEKASSRVHNDLIKLLNERKLRYSIAMHNRILNWNSIVRMDIDIKLFVQLNRINICVFMSHLRTTCFQRPMTDCVIWVRCSTTECQM